MERELHFSLLYQQLTPRLPPHWPIHSSICSQAMVKGDEDPKERSMEESSYQKTLSQYL
jgi:hypothetical protein